MAVTECASDGDYRAAMERATAEGKLAVVDFNADWCGPCRAMKPAFAQLAQRFSENTAFLSVNVDRCRGTAAAAGVSSIPAFHLFLRGEKVGELIGANPQGLATLIEAHVRNARPAAFAGSGHRLGDAPSRPVVVPEDAPRRVADPAMIEELAAMGFYSALAQKALLASNNDLGAAIDWITEHQEDSFSAPPAAAPAAPVSQQQQQQQPGKTLHNAVCNVCMKQIEGIRFKCKTCADWDECEVCHAKPLPHGTHDPAHDFDAHSEDIAVPAGGQAPKLSPEEVKAQQQRIRELIATKRRKRELEEQAHAAQMEIDRRKSGQELAAAREKARDVQAKRLDEERRRDQREAREALERVKRQIEQDKMERAAARGHKLQDTLQQQPPPPVYTETPMSHTTEVQIQIRLPDGTTMRRTFAPDSRVRDVYGWVARERTDSSAGPFALLMRMPRKTFSTPSDMALTLVDAGLAPSATLMVTAAAAQQF